MLKENLLALKWLFSLAEGNRVFIWLSMLLAVMAGAMGLVPALALYFMSVPLLRGAPLPEPFWLWPVMALASIFARYILMFVSTMCSHTAAFRMHSRLRGDIVAHMGVLPMGFFTERSSGAIRKVMNEDIESLEIFIAHHVPDMAKAVAVPVAAFILLAWQNLLFALCVFLPLVLACATLHLQHRNRAERTAEFFDNIEKMNTAVVEYIRGMPVVKVYNITMTSYQKLHSAIARQVEIAAAWIRGTTPFYALFRISLDSAPLFLMLCAVILLQTGSFDLNAWILALFFGTAMVAPLEQIYSSSNLLASLVEGMRRVDSLLLARPLPQSEHPAVPERFDIEYNGVSFSYGEGRALSGLSARLDEKRIHAFIGESGSGKTTATQLLMRFWDVEDGEIRIGGVNIRDIPLEKLMPMFSFVFQDVFIPDGTVAENIALGCPGAPREKIVRAAKLAQAHDFIERLEQGYDTRIGPGGTYLSGGEKQRISIARALFKDSPILVLDEATSSSDPENAVDIWRAIRAFSGQKTIILITHSLASAAHADNILLFSRGSLAGLGSHESLLRDNAAYKQMWENTPTFNRQALIGPKEVAAC